MTSDRAHPSFSFWSMFDGVLAQFLLPVCNKLMLQATGKILSGGSLVLFFEAVNGLRPRSVSLFLRSTVHDRMEVLMACVNKAALVLCSSACFFVCFFVFHSRHYTRLMNMVS